MNPEERKSLGIGCLVFSLIPVFMFIAYAAGRTAILSGNTPTKIFLILIVLISLIIVAFISPTIRIWIIYALFTGGIGTVLIGIEDNENLILIALGMAFFGLAYIAVKHLEDKEDL